MNKDISIQIKKLEGELKQVKAENRDLKKQVNSRRFRVAWHLATVFDRIFPQNSHRRVVVMRVAEAGLKARRRKRVRAAQKYHRLLQNLVSSKPVIIYDTIPWNTDLKQRSHHLALQLSQLDHVVVYLERAGKHKFKKINDNLVVTNNINMLTGLKSASRTMFLASSPSANRVVFQQAQALLDDNLELIYEYIDEIDEDISPMTHELYTFYEDLKKYKPVLILASAKKLVQNLIDDGLPKNRILLSENAVNVDDFDFTKLKPSMPADMEKIVELDKPIIGYYGALAPWLNAKMMNDIAKKRNDLSFVYIGPDYNGAQKSFQKLPNTYFLGSKDYYDLPNYAIHFNCAIIPFVHGEIAEATSPVKLFEYMAMGLPTVCTRDLEECKGYKFVHISKDTTEFEKNLDQAIREKSDDSIRQALLAYARQNTWEQRARNIIKCLNKK